MMKKKGWIILFMVLLIVLWLTVFLSTFFVSQKEGLTSTNYIENVEEKLTELEDIYNDKCEGKKSEYAISNSYKKTKMLNVVNTMPDNNAEQMYKTDLKKTLEDESITDDSVILKNTMKKIKDIRTEIKELSSQDKKSSSQE